MEACAEGRGGQGAPVKGLRKRVCRVCAGNDIGRDQENAQKRCAAPKGHETCALETATIEVLFAIRHDVPACRARCKDVEQRERSQSCNDSTAKVTAKRTKIPRVFSFFTCCPAQRNDSTQLHPSLSSSLSRWGWYSFLSCQLRVLSGKEAFSSQQKSETLHFCETVILFAAAVLFVLVLVGTR
eukprot:3277570-Rhodomonas_salina.1